MTTPRALAEVRTEEDPRQTRKQLVARIAELEERLRDRDAIVLEVYQLRQRIAQLETQLAEAQPLKV